MSEPVSGDDEGRPLRRDVLRNRQRVVEAASEAFAESGLEASYHDIAHRAGVGVGTVYRRFPQRAELVVAVFESRIDQMVQLAMEAMEQPTGQAALTWFLEKVLVAQTRDRGLRDVLAGHAPRSERMVLIRARLTPAVDALLGRAKSESALRPDVAVSDIAALIRALSLFHTSTQPDLWRRYLVLILDGFAPRRDGITPLPFTAPAGDEMDDLVGGGPHAGDSSLAQPHSQRS